MHEFQGDLLIGGARLRHLYVELEQELPEANSREWSLTGHLRLSPEQSLFLETDRAYRLLLSDGRAGQVIFSRISPHENRQELLAAFLPKSSSRHTPCAVAVAAGT
jgi:hypothetical protein